MADQVAKCSSDEVILDVASLIAMSDDELAELLRSADDLDDQLNAGTGCIGDCDITTVSYVIAFLGSLGNRYGALQGECGGLWIKSDGYSFLVDPGPSTISILNSYPAEPETSFQLACLDAILCSHIHNDHFGNLISVIEGMTCGMKITRGSVIGNETVIRTLSRMDPYYLSKTSAVVLSPYVLPQSGFDLEYAFEGPKTVLNIGPLKITPTPTYHMESRGRMDTGIGFFISGKRRDLWYTGDTALFEELISYVKCLMSGSKPLTVIANGGGANERVKSLTLRTHDLARIASELEPEFLAIQHYDQAYSGADYRIAQAIKVQRVVRKNGGNARILPSANGLLLNWDRRDEFTFRILLRNNVTTSVAHYLASL